MDNSLPVYFFANPYSTYTTHHVLVYSPYVFPEWIGNNFARFRSFIENLAPFRLNSTIVYINDKKVLLFLVDGLKQANVLKQEIKKHLRVRIDIIHPKK